MKEKYNEKQQNMMVAGVHDPGKGYITGHIEGALDAPNQKLRALQTYHGDPNTERMVSMKKISPLTRRKLAISAE